MTQAEQMARFVARASYEDLSIGKKHSCRHIVPIVVKYYDLIMERLAEKLP
jgi:hypothetical protein